ncbi:uncharacterized protein C1orf194 homolog [Argonauta hians]
MSFKRDRDPLPFPPKGYEESYTGFKKQRLCAITERFEVSHQAEPWCGLYRKNTLQSAQRNVHNIEDHQIPKDSLDFILASIYQNDTSMFSSKAETVKQMDTVREVHWYIYIKLDDGPPKQKYEVGHPVRIVPSERMEDFNSIKLAIESCHTQITNRGYCRKPDGGYYST